MRIPQPGHSGLRVSPVARSHLSIELSEHVAQLGGKIRTLELLRERSGEASATQIQEQATCFSGKLRSLGQLQERAL